MADDVKRAVDQAISRQVLRYWRKIAPMPRRSNEQGKER